MNRSPLARKTPLARSGAKRRYPEVDIHGNHKREFHDAARLQRVCAVTGRRKENRWHAHHVIYAAHIDRAGGPVWDPRNALRVGTRVHEWHHSRAHLIPLTALTDDNISFAFELLGPAAFDYLRRRYDGHDDRVELWLAETEAC